MKKILLFAIMLAIIPATSANAAWPFTGWGVDCENWIHTFAPTTTNHLCYDPIAGYYRDCETGIEVIWPEFQFDLWIELEIKVHFDWTMAEIHRASLYDNIVLIVPGWIEQNSGNYIIVRAIGNDPNGNAYSLDYMNFIRDIFDRTGPAYGSDLPVTWEYSLTGPTGPWTPMTGGGVEYMFLIQNVSHTDFWYRIEIDVEMHADDGFYKMAGDMCPVPGM